MNNMRVLKVEFENLSCATVTLRLDLKDVSEARLAQLDQLLVDALRNVVQLLPGLKG
jgi:hypothetical protein